MFIKDVIHRLAIVPPLCKLFIDTPEFNRLRNIKQLGLAYMVYPSAVHTRFEHSIGVMCLAGKVADVLEIKGREKDLLQLAGLMHDIGHVAFSHLFDYVMTEKNEKNPVYHHENRSVILIRQINSRLNVLSENEIEMISNMIHGTIPRDTSTPYLYEIISNSTFGVDVDRLDYIQRDLYHTGMPCFQADYIVACMRIKDGRLALQHKALPELEAMFEARKRLLTLICRHKTVIKIESQIRKGIERLLEEIDFETTWQKLTDNSVLTKLEENHSDIIEPIYNRQFKGLTTERQFEHISYVTKQDIDMVISKVNWY